MSFALILWTLLAFSQIYVPFSFALTWCGKNYMEGDPIVPPTGFFPGNKKKPEFTCQPRLQPYLAKDVYHATPSLLLLTSLHQWRTARLTAWTEDKQVVARLQINHSDSSVPLNLEGLQPRVEPYRLLCSLEIFPEGPRLDWHTSLVYLPEPANGSVSQLDAKTGGLLVRGVNDYPPKPIFPLGFYTDFGGYIAQNLTKLRELKQQGFNVIHLVSPFDDTTLWRQAIDMMEQLDLYMIHDMRHTFKDADSITQEVKEVKHRRNLLAWYTADEPDGPTDPPRLVEEAYRTIANLDGYHPVSLALNCDDHFFEDYGKGTDIILPTVYPIGNNVTFSSRYHTPCTRNFGCCGCDNCEGSLEDIARRLDGIFSRFEILGWRKFVWSIPQAFGESEFWVRAPTGREWAAQAILSVIHGARGITSWVDPTPLDIKATASKLAQILPLLSTFLFHEDVEVSRDRFNKIDVGVWRTSDDKWRALVLAVNLDQHSSHTVLLDEITHTASSSFRVLFRDGGEVGATHFELQAAGSIIFEIQDAEAEAISIQAIRQHDEL